MSIEREDLDAGRIDFSDVATGKRLPLIHPGQILRDEFLRPMKISVYVRVSRIRSSHHYAAPSFANFGIEGH